MSVVYIVIVVFVTALLLSPLLFPFWKVWSRLKSRHPDILPSGIDTFMDFINAAKDNAALRKKDLKLFQWCQTSQQILKMLPKSFVGQVAAFFVFLYFTGVLTSMIQSLFRLGNTHASP